jgi:hypothetical protein
MNRTTTYALLACLPVGGLLALGAHNRAVQAVEFVAVGSAGASVGWYGPRMALELHQDTVMRGRHRRAATMATRPRTAYVDDYGTEYVDVEPPAVEQAGAEQLPADREQTLPPSARYTDPYQYRPDDEATHVVDVPVAAPSDRDMNAERGVWYTSTGTAQSYTAPPSTAAAADEDLYARGPWMPVGT